MGKLPLPFWIVTKSEHVLVPPEHIPCADSEAAHVFTSSAWLTEFLATREGGRWQVDLVADRDAALLGIADLHAKGITTLCIDPQPDGSGGELLSLVEALDQFRDSKPPRSK